MSFKGFGGDKIFSDAVKDAIGNDLVTDQFDIISAGSFYGSAQDDYITGSILTRKKNPYGGDSTVYFTFTTGSRGRIFRKSEADTQPFSDVPWGLKVNRSYRVSQAFDSDEKFYDSRFSSYSARDFREAVRFSSPYSAVVDSKGNTFVSDYNNNVIKKISLHNYISTFAGSGTAGYVDATGTSAQFDGPAGLAIDKYDNIYVADDKNCTIRKITPAGVVTTIAGSGTAGYVDATGTSAQFYNPVSLDLDELGNIYVADRYNHCVRKITPAGVVTTIAGSGTAGYVDADGINARFFDVTDVALDNAGNIFVSDNLNHSIRMITPTRKVMTIAGGGGNTASGSINGTGTNARFWEPAYLAMGENDTIYVSDNRNTCIRKIEKIYDIGNSVVTTLAGGFSPGYVDGIGSAARFGDPRGIMPDGQGGFFVAEWLNNDVRRVTPQGKVTTFIRTDLFAGDIVNKIPLICQPYGSIPAPETSLLSTKQVFRRDKYGQFRDMLEQRPYTKLIRTAPSPTDNDAIVPADLKISAGDKLGGLLNVAPTPSAVSVVFVKQKYEVDGRSIGRIYSEAIDPISGSSQNLSTEAVSVDAFYDGISLQR